MAITLSNITNGVLYVDGNTTLGQIEELTLPNMKHKTAEHKALGLYGTMEFASGLELLELTLKLNCYYPELLGKLADPTRTHRFMVRGEIAKFSGGNKTGSSALSVTMDAAVKEIQGGAFKQAEKVTFDMMLSVYSYKLEIDRVPVMEIDVPNNIMRADGLDVLATYRRITGQ